MGFLHICLIDTQKCVCCAGGVLTCWLDEKSIQTQNAAPVQVGFLYIGLMEGQFKPNIWLPLCRWGSYILQKESPQDPDRVALTPLGLPFDWHLKPIGPRDAQAACSTDFSAAVCDEAAAVSRSASNRNGAFGEAQERPSNGNAPGSHHRQDSFTSCASQDQSLLTAGHAAVSDSKARRPP